MSQLFSHKNNIPVDEMVVQVIKEENCCPFFGGIDQLES